MRHPTPPSPEERRPVPGFTLVELLVVISIIALLIAILLPALMGVRGMARQTQCLSQHRQLVIAWSAYATDASGRFVSALPTRGGVLNFGDEWLAAGSEGWAVEIDTGLGFTDREARAAAIRLGNLFPYTQSVEIHRCPAEPEYAGQERYLRSYSINDFLNGAEFFGEISAWEPVTRMPQLKSPGETFVFIDDADQRNDKLGAFYVTASQGVDVWSDMPGDWHPGRGNVHSFADGRAIVRGLSDRAMLNEVTNGDGAGSPNGVPASDPELDLRYYQRATRP